jgi:cytochrome P450 family 150 subfamily A5
LTISPAQIDTIDFFGDPALVADPYPLLARMRAESPVLREPTQGVLVVTGYDEVLAWSAITRRSRRAPA